MACRAVGQKRKVWSIRLFQLYLVNYFRKLQFMGLKSLATIGCTSAVGQTRNLCCVFAIDTLRPKYKRYCAFQCFMQEQYSGSSGTGFPDHIYFSTQQVAGNFLHMLPLPGLPLQHLKHLHMFCGLNMAALSPINFESR